MEFGNECTEAFLLEMPVVCEGFSEAFATHRLHGDAIDWSVAFVRPDRVELRS